MLPLRSLTTLPPRRAFQRLLSTRATPVQLEYDLVRPQDGSETNRPLIILHGLFGMKRNWLSLSKAFAGDLQRPVYVLDLRNHGHSPHAKPMNYDAMTLDVLEFCASRSLTNVSLLGHSMGGKVAMALALSPELPSDLLNHLIVADIAPARADLSPEFQGYVEAMRKIEKERISSRKEAQDILTPYEQDAMTRAFLLTNLDTQAKPLRFRIPLDIVGSAIRDIGWFPYGPGERTWGGKTLFIKGSKSRHINKNNMPLLKEFFPNMALETLDAGHWVHAEKPTEFRKLVTDFITASP